MKKRLLTICMITLFLCSCSSNKDKLNNSSVFSTNTEITEVIVESSAITETDENNESKENTEIKENASLYTDSKAEVESNTEIFSSKPEKTSEPESTTNERSEEIPKENTEKPIIEPIKSVPLNADADDCKAIAQLLVEHINKYREADGVSKVKKLNGLTRYAEFRSIQLVTNFKHDTLCERAAATALKYGKYVDPAEYGMEGEPYYTANCAEAIAKAGYIGTVQTVSQRLGELVRNSNEHWRYVGSEQYKYVAVGITYKAGMWYCCIAVAIDNSDEY